MFVDMKGFLDFIPKIFTITKEQKLKRNNNNQKTDRCT